jgi:uncharacterized protein (DUF1501 family)
MTMSSNSIHHTTSNRTSRRALFQLGLGGAAMATVSRLGLTNAWAQAAPDYKALVCIFLSGGHDGHNLIVPQSQVAFEAYRRARGGLALPDNNTRLHQVVTKAGTPYGFNDGLAALGPLWTQEKLAVVANVGMLVQPTTREQFLARSVPLPSNLFSHSDQIVQNQTGDANGSGGTGWAGRAADALQTMNNAATFPAAFSMNGAALFTTGSVIQSASLYPGFDLTLNGMGGWPATMAAAKAQALQEIIKLDSGMSVIQAANKVRQDAAALNQMIRSAGNGASLATVFPGTNLGRQLQQVAQIIRLRETTAIRRQVFFCSIGGFDTHSSQSWNYWDLLRQVGDAMFAFYAATAEMGVADKVTTFTQSDFGRSLEPSGTGSDHGWGNHHLVMGGTVRGGDMYGTFPMPALGGPDDSGSRGVLIPTTSLDQYGATMAKWFGVEAASMTSVFPNIGNFPTADLGFLG